MHMQDGALGEGWDAAGVWGAQWVRLPAGAASCLVGLSKTMHGAQLMMHMTRCIPRLHGAAGAACRPQTHREGTAIRLPPRPADLHLHREGPPTMEMSPAVVLLTRLRLRADTDWLPAALSRGCAAPTHQSSCVLTSCANAPAHRGAGLSPAHPPVPAGHAVALLVLQQLPVLVVLVVGVAAALALGPAAGGGGGRGGGGGGGGGAGGGAGGGGGGPRGAGGGGFD